MRQSYRTVQYRSTGAYAVHAYGVLSVCVRPSMCACVSLPYVFEHIYIGADRIKVNSKTHRISFIG